MRRISTFLLVVLLVSTCPAFAGFPDIVKTEANQGPSFLGYVGDEILVKFDPQALGLMNKETAPRGRLGIPELDYLAIRHDARSIKPQFAKAIKRQYRGRTVDLAGWHKIKFQDQVDVQTVIEDYKAVPGVVEAHPISILSLYNEPNDPWFQGYWWNIPPFGSFQIYQWHLQYIQAPQAWGIQTGSSQVIVAVPDSGVRYFHKDLGGADASYVPGQGTIPPASVQGNMWINNDDPVDGLDNDGNGFVDDWIGYDFVSGTDPLFPALAGEDGDTLDNDPRDFGGHGTMCAGIVAGLNNNGYGVASVAGGWGDGTLQGTGNGVKIMPLRIGWLANSPLYGIVGVIRTDFASEALVYAANNGAKIANCSWGSDSDMKDAVDYFLAGGGLIFKAAGNYGLNDPDYMCNRADVISVAATDFDPITGAEYKADFSNYGPWVDISAPGVDIITTEHDYSNPATDYPLPPPNFPILGIGNGTSFSSPIAAGVAALIWSKYPQLSAQAVRTHLQNTADPLAGDPYQAAGWLGSGRVNAYRAVSETPGPSNPECSVTQLSTGKYVITGRGKNKKITYEPSLIFKQGEAVVFRTDVTSDGSPVTGATVQIAISGRENHVITSAPSDASGLAEATWQTKAPNKRGIGGTATGAYTATVTGVMASGYDWDGQPSAVGFSITPK